jgi:acyl-CoA reductase-like NAD-dependent aldehyde dehydrogenase
LNRGQSCIGVQRILVHSAVYDALREKLIAKTKSLIMGDPKKEETFVGPMISESESSRLAGWMESAVQGGAKIVAGGKVDGAKFEATPLEDVQRDSDLYRKEAFGPVAILEPFDDFGAALAAVNDSDFGLQAGVFTDSLANAHRAWDGLEVGGVVINDVPSFRVDNMPYGGVKDSGLGREGIRDAIEDMTEMRLMVMRETW